MDDIDSLTIEKLEQRKLALSEDFNTVHACIDSLAIRLRTFSSGHIHNVHQCTVCGCQTGGPLSKAKAAEQLAGAQPLVFDDTIEPTHRQVRRQLLEQINRVTKEFPKRLDPVSSAMDAEEVKKAAQRLLKGNRAISSKMTRTIHGYGATCSNKACPSSVKSRPLLTRC